MTNVFQQEKLFFMTVVIQYNQVISQNKHKIKIQYIKEFELGQIKFLTTRICAYDLFFFDKHPCGSVIREKHTFYVDHFLFL